MLQVSLIAYEHIFGIRRFNFGAGVTTAT